MAEDAIRMRSSSDVVNPASPPVLAAGQRAQLAAGQAHPADRVIDLVEPLEPLRIVLARFEHVERGPELLGQDKQVRAELVADLRPGAVRPRWGLRLLDRLSFGRSGGEGGS